MAKSKTASQSRIPAKAKGLTRSTAVALTDAPTTTIAFGVILDVNGHPVPVSSDDISKLKTQGVELTLQDPARLGSIDDFRAWVKTQFGVQLPGSTDFPTPLQGIVGAITGMVVTIEKAHLKVPATGSTTYTLQANGMFQAPLPLIPNVLGVSGFVFGVSNEATDSGS